MQRVPSQRAVVPEVGEAACGEVLADTALGSIPQCPAPAAYGDCWPAPCGGGSGQW